MSTLKVNTIQDTTGNDAISISSDGSVGFAQTQMSHRNLIINGAMQVAQRGTSETGVTSGGYHTCDRFQVSHSLGTWTEEQSTDAPNGFSNSLKMTCTTTATPVAGSECGIIYYPEAQDLQHLNYGSSSAKKITISFWVKCSETGNFVLEVLQNDSVRHEGHLVTINTADTWEYKTVTFDGDISGTINNDNGAGLSIKWWTFVGTYYQTTGSLQTSWGALDQGARGYGQTINIVDATSDYFAITGVQLEVGSVATPFEHRSYGEELARCQRYYWKIDNGYNDGSTGKKASTGTILSFNSCGTFPVTMRTNPTKTIDTSSVISENCSGVAVNTDESSYQTRTTSSGGTYRIWSWACEFDAEL